MGYLACLSVFPSQEHRNSFCETKQKEIDIREIRMEGFVKSDTNTFTR